MRASLLLLAAALFAPASARAEGYPVAALDTVLTRFVHAGRVDYGALARDRGALTRFLAATRDAQPGAWPRTEQIAFWINAYNARVLDGVARRPGLKSVLDVGRGGPKSAGFFAESTLTAGQRLSLDGIESLLRQRFGDPRVHMVLNCASASCPALPMRALRGASLDSTLTAATRAFLVDTSRNVIQAGRPLRLSAVFDWYAGDFQPSGVRAFVQAFGPARLRGDEPVEFRPYDWSLNGHW